jgi:hypothetical protein
MRQFLIRLAPGLYEAVWANEPPAPPLIEPVRMAQGAVPESSRTLPAQHQGEPPLESP